MTQFTDTHTYMHHMAIDDFLRGWFKLQAIDLTNTLRPRQNGRRFPDDIFKCIFLNENEWISLKISLKFIPKVRINNIPALVQIMAWRRSGDKPLSEPMIVSLLTHICVTRPQWVNTIAVIFIIIIFRGFLNINIYRYDRCVIAAPVTPLYVTLCK